MASTRATRSTSSQCIRLVALALLITTSAHAQQQSAKQVYESALAEYKAQHFAAAAQGFERAYALRGQVLLLFNIGQCHRKLGDFVKAREAYERYLALASPTEDAATVQEAKTYVAEIQQYMQSQAPPTRVAPAIATTTTTRAEPASVVQPASPAVTLTATPEPKPKRPLSRNPYLWTGVVVGVVVIGLAVGLGVGLGDRSNHPSTTLGTQKPMFP